MGFSGDADFSNVFRTRFLIAPMQVRTQKGARACAKVCVIFEGDRDKTRNSCAVNSDATLVISLPARSDSRRRRTVTPVAIASPRRSGGEPSVRSAKSPRPRRSWACSNFESRSSGLALPLARCSIAGMMSRPPQTKSTCAAERLFRLANRSFVRAIDAVAVALNAVSGSIRLLCIFPPRPFAAVTKLPIWSVNFPVCVAAAAAADAVAAISPGLAEAMAAAADLAASVVVGSMGSFLGTTDFNA